MDSKKCWTISVACKLSIRELGVAQRLTRDGLGTVKHAVTATNGIVIDNYEPEHIGMCWGHMEIPSIQSATSFWERYSRLNWIFVNILLLWPHIDGYYLDFNGKFGLKIFLN